MASTPDQKVTFQRSFATLLKQTPKEIQKLWDGEIKWEDTANGSPSKALLDHVTNNLEPEHKARYIDMLNQLRSKAK